MARERGSSLLKGVGRRCGRAGVAPEGAAGSKAPTGGGPTGRTDSSFLGMEGGRVLGR